MTRLVVHIRNQPPSATRTEFKRRNAAEVHKKLDENYVTKNLPPINRLLVLENILRVNTPLAESPRSIEFQSNLLPFNKIYGRQGNSSNSAIFLVVP